MKRRSVKRSYRRSMWVAVAFVGMGTVMGPLLALFAMQFELAADLSMMLACATGFAIIGVGIWRVLELDHVDEADQ